MSLFFPHLAVSSMCFSYLEKMRIPRSVSWLRGSAYELKRDTGGARISQIGAWSTPGDNDSVGLEVHGMERSFSLKGPGGYQLFGAYHECPGASDLAVIQVHGLGGDMGSFSQLTMARFFAANGIPVFRFNQYTDLPGGRQFHNTTISGHVEDTRLVMDYAEQTGFKRLVLIGHSLGAAVAITAVDSRVRGIMLWDPAGSPAERIVDWETRDERLGLAYLDWRTRIILGESWIADAKRFPDPFQRLATFAIPVAIVAADQGELLAQCERFRSVVTAPLEYVVLNNCGHTFLEEGAMEQLGEASLRWLRTLKGDRFA